MNHHEDAAQAAAAIRQEVLDVIRASHTVRIVWGVVSAPVTSPVHSVTFTPQGSTNGLPGIRYLSSYSPTAGDVAIAAAVGSDLWIIGKLA